MSEQQLLVPAEILHHVDFALEEGGQQVDALLGDVPELFETGHATENLFLFALAVSGEEMREQHGGAVAVARIHLQMKQLPDGGSHLLRLARGGSNDARLLIGSFVGGGNGARFRDGGHPPPAHGGVPLLLQRLHVPSGGGRVPQPSHPPVGGAEKEGSGARCQGQGLREWHATRPDAGGS